MKKEKTIEEVLHAITHRRAINALKRTKNILKTMKPTGSYQEPVSKLNLIFDMGVFCEPTICGTAACIGGFMGFELGARNMYEARTIAAHLEHTWPKFRRLFRNRMEVTDPQLAVQAINQFLVNPKQDNPWEGIN